MTACCDIIFPRGLLRKEVIQPSVSCLIHLCALASYYMYCFLFLLPRGKWLRVVVFVVVEYRSNHTGQILR